MSMAGIWCSATAARCAGLERTCKMPPCTRGCSVFTRPSSISGKPVSAATSFTSMPLSLSNLAVPPVETSSTFIAASRRANSTTPVLSVTPRIARWILGNGWNPYKNWNEDYRGSYVRQESPMLVTDYCLRGFGFRFQFDLAVFHLYRVLHRMAAIIFTDLVGLLLDEGFERIEGSGGARLAVLLFGGEHGIIK